MRAFRIAKPCPDKFLTLNGLSNCPSLLCIDQLRVRALLFEGAANILGLNNGLRSGCALDGCCDRLGVDQE
jgi:hypothetical protein